MADITITEGDTLEVDYSVENTGDGAGDQDVRLTVDNILEDTDANVVLDPGQTATGTLQWLTESGDAVTDAIAEVLTEDDTDGITVTVEEASAIPDSGMFQDPIYQYWAGSYDGGDGDSPFDYPEVLTDSTATAVGAPFFRADQSGFTAGEYDGIDDGHDALTGQLPTGAVGVSMAALVYVPTAHRGRVFSYGDGNVGSSIALGVRGDNTVEATVQGSSYSFATGGTYSTGEWITIGASFNSDTANSVLNGSFVATDGGDTYNISNQDAGIAYRGFASLDWFDGYVAEIIVSATNEPEQAFADYHNDRLG